MKVNNFMDSVIIFTIYFSVGVFFLTLVAVIISFILTLITLVGINKANERFKKGSLKIFKSGDDYMPPNGFPFFMH